MELEAGEDEEEEVEEAAIGTKREIGVWQIMGEERNKTKSKLIDFSFSFHLIVIFLIV
jgi:hypothetical protein